MHQNQPIRIDLRQEPPNLLFADWHVAVAEEKVNRAFDFHFQARLVSQLNPLGEAGRCDASLRVVVDLRIEFAGDDSSAAVCLEAFGDPECADAAKCSGLYHESWFDSRDHRTQKLQDFD